MDTITLQDGTVLEVARYPLPEGVEDCVMNKDQIALAMNVSKVTISSWIALGFPVLTQGTNGQAYQFQLSHCFAWRTHRDDTEAQARAQADTAAANMQMAFRNLDPDETDAERGMSAKQVQEVAKADFERSRAAEMRGELVRVDRVRALQEQQLINVRQAFMTIPDYAEQEFGLTPDQARKLQDRCEGALIELQDSLRRLLPGAANTADLSQARQQALI